MEPTASARAASSLPVRTHRGDTIDLFKPGQASLLMFVPAAFTPVCGSELQELAGLSGLASSLDVRILVASCDTPATLRAWLADADGSAGFIGISDHWPHGALASHFAAFDERTGTAHRRSFAIDAAGSWVQVAASPAGVARAKGDHERGIRFAASGWNAEH